MVKSKEYRVSLEDLVDEYYNNETFNDREGCRDGIKAVVLKVLKSVQTEADPAHSATPTRIALINHINKYLTE
jgi:hypothetical protein